MESSRLGAALILCVLDGIFFTLGVIVSKGRRRIWLPLAAACLVLVLAKAALQHCPVMEYALLPWVWYPLMRPFWFFPFAMMLFGIAFGTIPSRVRRDAILVVAGLLFAYGVFMAWPKSPLEGERFRETFDRDGICMQNTEFTCGPAAAVTFLKICGVYASEREMTELALTTSETGTDEMGMARALNVKVRLIGKRAYVRSLDWEELSSGEMPLLTTIRLTDRIDHWIVLMDVRGDKVVYADPTVGKLERSKPVFLARWRRVVVGVK